MLSYLHAFHAGNHADILKHAALIQVLKKLNQKDAPYSFFDTHSGSGLYSLQGERAQKTGEAERGVLALDKFARQKKTVFNVKESAASENPSQCQEYPGFDLEQIPCAILDYLDFVRPFLRLDLYPGSPIIERSFLRQDDFHAICELHPAEFEALKENCAQHEKTLSLKRAAPDLAENKAQKANRLPRGAHRDDCRLKDIRSQILNKDGFKALLSLAPPKIKRGAVLIDPSYEESSDYEEVRQTAVAVHKKWSAGIIMIWYPLLAHRTSEIEGMTESICEAAKIQNQNTEILRAEFLVDAPQSHVERSLTENAAQKEAARKKQAESNDGKSEKTFSPRLYGSGLLVVNAPWKLALELEEALAFLARVPFLSNKPSYCVKKI